MKDRVLEIHSRKSQGARDRVSQLFKTGTSTVLFTSDVSARGMDYPDVSLVVQVGLPANKEQVIYNVYNVVETSPTL
jgi:ATP-dependent RNA helicase MSS116